MRDTDKDHVRLLIKKNKKYLWHVKSLAPFKEPVLLLIRRTHKVDIFEDIKTSEYSFEHTDGSERKLLLDPRYLCTFDYGPDMFKGYICDEDNPIPLPSEPLVTSEMLQVHENKLLYDIRKHMGQEIGQYAKLVLYLALGVALVLAVYYMFGPKTQPIIISQDLIRNLTNATAGAAKTAAATAGNAVIS